MMADAVFVVSTAARRYWWPFVGLVIAAGLLAICLLGAAVRVGCVALDLRRVMPLTTTSFLSPAHDRQRVGAPGE